MMEKGRERGIREREDESQRALCKEIQVEYSRRFISGPVKREALESRKPKFLSKDSNQDPGSADSGQAILMWKVLLNMVTNVAAAV